MVSVLETEEDAQRRFVDGVKEDMDVVGVSEEDAAEGSMEEDDWPRPPLKETGTLEEHSSPTKAKTRRLTQWYICSQQYSGIPGSVYVLNGQDGGVLRG